VPTNIPPAATWIVRNYSTIWQREVQPTILTVARHGFKGRRSTTTAMSGLCPIRI